VKIDDKLIDFGGIDTVDRFVKRFERNELTHVGGRITGIRPIKNGDLPDAPRDPELSQKLSRLIK
jgi:hypothetical protein